MAAADGGEEDISPRRESAEGEPASGPGRIELTLTGDRREVEAMSLEFRRLAKAYGLEIGAMRVLPAAEPPRGDAAEGGSS
ncbi:MAG: hypothetical protein ACREM3_01295 [Candidatus Rokuibacteriota bacterium]